MARIGINLWVWTSPINNTSLHLLDKVADMGFDTVELPLETADALDAKRVAAKLRETGLRAIGCGVFPPRPRPDQRQRGLSREQLEPHQDRQPLLRGGRRDDDDRSDVLGGGQATARLAGRIFSEPGQRIALETVMRDLRRMYGLGEFEQIQFHAQPEPDGRAEVVYDVKEKPWGPTYLKLGLNLQTDFDNDAHWGLLLNVTRRSLNERGAEWRNELQMGNRQRALSEYYQPVDARGFFFLAPSVEYDDRIESLYDGENKVAEYDANILKVRFDLGVQVRHYAELRVGPVWGHAKADVSTGASDLPELDEDIGGLSVRLTSDRLDRSVFPRKGFRAHVEYAGASEDLGGDRTYDRLYGYYKHYLSWADHTLQLGLTAGSSLGSDLPEYDSFRLGGPFLFSGLAEGQLRDRYLGVASLGYRHRLSRLPPGLGQAAYALLRADAGNVWHDAAEVGADDVLFGASAGLGLDTIAGPVVIGYGRAEAGFSNWYFSLGTSF